MGVKTPGPGSKSFTTAVIKAMTKSVGEVGSVIVQKLHSNLCHRALGLFATPVHIGFHRAQFIRLEHVAPPKSAAVGDNDSSTFLQLMIKIKDGLTVEGTE
ncbi:hypothetical protein QBC36DRAFT_315163 [Triangularia setosa]|uniref:Uncharacterized protein n=1 Tax=Triangularia setosa TaxID=2587417 RepID=A0AAN6VYM4_9PEZI|nr:hypothetical protein QBC36DRAFT_315163 [Podospora setosa]